MLRIGNADCECLIDKKIVLQAFVGLVVLLFILTHPRVIGLGARPPTEELFVG